MNATTNGGAPPVSAPRPEESKATLLKRLVEVNDGPREMLQSEKAAQAFVELVVSLSGYARRPGSEEPDWCGRAQAIREAFSGAYRGGGPEAAYAAAMDAIRRQVGARMPVAAAEVEGAMPTRLMWLVDREETREGAVLSAGTVCLLAGEGGAAKTTLALQIALYAAARHVAPNAFANKPRGWCAGLECRPGPVLFVGYEDSPQACRWKLDRLIGTLDEDTAAAARAGLAHVHFLDMANRPLYGPPPGFGYNHRPEPLEGWWDLRRAVTSLRPVLTIIDPALSAYVGEPNAAAAVREFISALIALASETQSGVLILAHSTKAARQSSDPFDPGHIGGSAAWSDGVRGVMVMARDEDRNRVLRVAKANYGLAYVQMLLEAIREGDRRAPLGFTADGRWTPPTGFGESNSEDAVVTPPEAEDHQKGSDALLGAQDRVAY